MPSVLPRDERHQLDARCDLLVSDALAALAAFTGAAPPERWRPLTQRELFTFHCEQLSPPPPAPPAAGSEQLRRFLLSGYLTGSLAQVTSGLYCDSTRDLTLQQCVLLAGADADAIVAGAVPRSVSAATGKQPAGCAFLDAAVLQVTEQETRHAPFRFAGVKWCAWRSSAGVDRDLLAYERSGVAALDADDSNNSSGEATEIMYHVVQAIDRPPHALDSSVKFPPGLRHMKLSACFLYRQVCDDLVECFALGEYPALRRSSAGGAAGGESTLQRAEDDAVAERVLTVSRALAAYSAKRLSRLIEKNRKLPVIMGKSCLRCGARRTVFDPLRTCSICKKSVCQSCRQEKTIFKLNIDTNRPETEVFCRKCLQCSNLPDASPVSLHKIKQQQQQQQRKARANSGSSDRSASSSSQPPPQQQPPSSSERDRYAHRHRNSVASSGSGGGRDSIGSVGSSSASSSVKQRHSHHQHPQPQQYKQHHKQQVRATMVAGPNYEGLFRHYAVEKPALTRGRSSTLPSSTSSDSSNDGGSFVNNRNSVVGVVSAREVLDDPSQQHQHHQHRPRLQPLAFPVAAEPVDLVQGEEVELGECLRDTQIGLPVILVGVKDESLRRTQLGVPVGIEVGRMSEPASMTTSRATLFEDVGVSSSTGAAAARASAPNALPTPPSPRRSDLYLDLPAAPVKSASGTSGGGVEKLYQTYLERREKLQTAAADEQQLRNTRLEVSRVHHQQQHERRAREGDGAQPSNQLLHDHDAAGASADSEQPPRFHHLYQPHRRQPNQSERFRVDLYAQP